MLYCTWFDTNPQNDLVTTNTVIIYIYIYIHTPTPPLGQDMTQGQFLNGV